MGLGGSGHDHALRDVYRLAVGYVEDAVAAAQQGDAAQQQAKDTAADDVRAWLEAEYSILLTKAQLKDKLRFYGREKRKLVARIEAAGDAGD